MGTIPLREFLFLCRNICLFINVPRLGWVKAVAVLDSYSQSHELSPSQQTLAFLMWCCFRCPRRATSHHQNSSQSQTQLATDHHHSEEYGVFSITLEENHVRKCSG